MSCNCTNQCKCVDPCSDSQIRRIVDDAVADRVEDMEGLASDAQGSATAAENSATQSAQSATQSQQFATTAGNNATSAAQSAQQAAVSATAAAESATAAVQVTTGLKQVADELTDTANRLGDKVDGAIQAAEDAEAAAQTATTAANTATTAATNAGISETAAVAAATSASGSADTATQAVNTVTSIAAQVSADKTLIDSTVEDFQTLATDSTATVNSATQAAQAAQLAAETAQASAQASANTASTDATTSTEAADTATQAATQAEAYVVAAQNGITAYANEAAILATTPTQNQVAYAADTMVLYSFDTVAGSWTNLGVTYNNWIKNLKNLDTALNSALLTWQDVAGITRNTWAGIEDKVKNSNAAMAFATADALLAYTPTTANVLAYDTQLGEYYYWNGTAWAKAIYQEKVNTINNSRLAILGTGANLFNKASITSGYYINELTGNPTANASYGYSDFIDVEAGATYASSASTRVVSFYDANHAYIGNVVSTFTFVVPSNAKYIRVSILLTAVATYMLNKGLSILNYQDYQLTIKDKAAGNLINLYGTLGFKPGKNLLNPLTFKESVHLSSTGTLITDADLTTGVTDFISINPLLSYVVNRQWRAAAYYDSTGAFISTQINAGWLSTPIQTLVIPSNAAYMRVEVARATVAYTQIEQNTVSTGFEAYKLKAPTTFGVTAVEYAPEVTLDSLGIFGPGANLFNKSTVNFGYVNEWGSIMNTTSYKFSELINVLPETQYTGSGTMRFVSFYDSNKTFLSTVANVSTFTTPTGTAYVRLSIAIAAIDTFTLAKGAGALPYEAYKNVLNAQTPDGRAVTVPGSLVDSSTMDFDFVNHGLFVLGKNKFNKDTVNSGFINESGSIQASDTYQYSDYIAVTPGQAYVLNTGARFIAYYTSTKSFVKSDASSSSGLLNFTAPEGVYYVRITITNAKNSILQVEEGTTSTEYVDYGYYLISETPDGAPIKVTSDDSSSKEVTPASYGLSRLRETHMRLDRLAYNQNQLFVWAMLGDSYTRGETRYALKCAQRLWSKFDGKTINDTVPPEGYGWRSFGFDANGNNSDIVGSPFTRSGFTCAYNTGHGPDISSVSSSTVGAYISYAYDFTLGLDTYLFAEGGSGIISYIGTGMSEATQIDLSGYASGMQIIKLDLPTTGSGTVRFEVVSGSVTLYGVNIVKPDASGVIVHKMGGSGANSNQWVNAMDARWSKALTSLAPNLVTIMLGTNDQGGAMAPATFKSNLLFMIDTVRVARPTADIMLICPAENNRTNSIPMTTYADVMYDIAKNERDVAFLNLQDSFGKNASDYAYGSSRSWMVADGVHPDPNTGGYAIAAAISKALLGSAY